MHRFVFVVIFLILVSASIALFSRIIYYGLQHVEAASLSRLAGENWQKRDFIGATDAFVTATKLTIEGGIRSMVAQPFIDNIEVAEQQGNLRDALDNCREAVFILGRYDDEGSLDYGCMGLDYQIQHPKTPPAQRITSTTTQP